jgi:hypothetical protein
MSSVKPSSELVNSDPKASLTGFAGASGGTELMGVGYFKLFP